MLGNFVGVEELEGAARTLDTEFYQLTETEVNYNITRSLGGPLGRLFHLWVGFFVTDGEEELHILVVGLKD